MSAHSNLPHSSTTEHWQSDPDAVPEFDHPRTHADRVVLALRYPSRADAEPIASVSKVIAGGVYLLAVYDADILAALLRMGWEVA